MKKLEFPRERKRDSLFGGLRKKSKQDLKEQQLAVYVEKVDICCLSECFFLCACACLTHVSSYFSVAILGF